MKSKFAWYIEPSAEEIKQIWQTGILTLDANVLLDLYRYHTQTKENLLKAIESFPGRVWISDQAAKEFIRNRKTVIASAGKTFREASGLLQELSKSVEGAIGRMRGHRLIPRPNLDELAQSLVVAIEKASAAVEIAANGHPDYFANDEILTRLLQVFDGRIGVAPDAAAYAALVAEGERRKLAKIPPGYMDDDKEGDRPYGDYMLWNQTLDLAKALSKPIILVTSERKEDWWEKHSGKSVGPRIELLEEAHTYAGQRVLIYQTDFFLEMASTMFGGPVDTNAVQEIREVSARRAAAIHEQPAVRVRQSVSQSDPWDNAGILEIELLRPVTMMTGSGRFSPSLTDPPEIHVELANAPADSPKILVRAATGTNFDFNVHLKSAERGTMLPVGNYTIKYSASSFSSFVEGLLDDDSEEETRRE